MTFPDLCPHGYRQLPGRGQCWAGLPPLLTAFGHPYTDYCHQLIEQGGMPGSSAVALGNHPIQIPSDFPGILKQYTKAAIRTQPRDLLQWSAAYFRCLAR